MSWQLRAGFRLTATHRGARTGLCAAATLRDALPVGARLNDRRRFPTHHAQRSRPGFAFCIPRSAIATPARPGFTLIELLVVITILLILTAITVSAFNSTMTNERIREAARQVQSFLEGARDRAIYAREPRGVRFLVDATNSHTSSSMIFIGAPQLWSEGTIRLERLDDDGNGVADSPTVSIVRGLSGTGWYNLKLRGQLGDYEDLNSNGSLDPGEDLNGNGVLDLSAPRIKIPGNQNGTWYRVFTHRLGAEDANGNRILDGGEDLNGNGRLDDEIFELIVPYRDPGTTPETEVDAFEGGGNDTYLLELPPAILPESEPVLLPQGIVIDLDQSQIPGIWIPAPGSPPATPYSGRMDILFSPRGTVIGSGASMGLIHFFLQEQVAADVHIPPDAPLWQSGTTYQQGAWVVPLLTPPGRGLFMYQVIQPPGGGTSGGTVPLWPETVGATVVDGGVTWQAFEIGDRIIATLFPRTGKISTHPVFLDDPPQPTIDPFRFAETGEDASQ